jgi:hypothetical protein
MFKPNLSILPEPQRQLWGELRNTPKSFVLYGGTALALRLGHRQSEDFDFFSNKPFQPNSLRDSIPYLKHAEITQFQDNTLTAIVGNGPVKLSFFGSLGMKRVQDPDVAEENGIQIASLLDLLASKLKTVQSRAAAKDYRDIVASFDAGLGLAEGLAAAAAIYGKDFNGVLSLKALTFFEDGDLPSLTRAMQKRLLEAATSVNIRELPPVAAKPGLSRREEGS